MITMDKRLRNRRKRLARQGKIGCRANMRPNKRARGGCGWNHIVPGGERMLKFTRAGTAKPATPAPLPPYQEALESGDERMGKWHLAGANIGPIECGEFNGEKITTRSRKAKEQARMSYNVAVQHGIIRED